MTQNYGYINDADKLELFFEKIVAQGKPIGFDIETGYDGPNREGIALKPYHPDFKVVGLSFTNATTWARYVPIAHDIEEGEEDFNIERVRGARIIWRMLQHGLGVAHNLPFEQNGLARMFRDVLWDDPEVGEEVRRTNGFYPYLSDSLIEAAMSQLYADKKQGGPGLGLKALTKAVFGHDQAEIKTLFPELNTPAKLKTLRFNSRKLTDEVVAYACEDAVWCLGLHQIHWPMVENNFMFKVEMQLLSVLMDMELEALELDWDKYEREYSIVQRFGVAMNEEIQGELSEMVGEVVNVNFNSPKQVADILFNKLALPVKERSAKTNAPSTSEKALRAIASKSEAVRSLLEWREVKALESRYLKKYLSEDIRYAYDGRAHPSHNQVGAATGRFSVDGVSYQQWPKPYHYELKDGTVYDLNYRDFFMAPQDYRIMGFDFSQVELRVLAGMANETGLLEAFANGTDIHSATASIMMGIPLDKITKKDRAKGKTLNFAVVYGSGASNIADLLGISKDEAQGLLDQYFRTFSKLKAWMDERVMEGRAQGYVETKFGRKFKVWEFLSGNAYIRSKGERMCVNAPVQGGAADYIKIGMVRVSKAIKKAEEDGLIPKGGIRLVMTIHDALEFYVHESISSQTVIDLLHPCVSFPVAGLPEILAEWHEGYRWGTVFEINMDSQHEIQSWEYKVETPYKEEFVFKAESFPEALADYETWEKAYTPPVKVKQTLQLTESDIKRMNALEALGEDEIPQDILDDLSGDLVNVAGNSDALEDMTDVKEAVDEEEPPWLHSPRSVYRIRIEAMPSKEAWTSFKQFLADRPGDGRVDIITPQGEVSLVESALILLGDHPIISTILGGAQVVETHEELATSS
jgi:DNA polymerase I-like protein with 3'-5' exonuclease and polymerase domains